MEVSLDAMLAIQKRPKDDKLDNPFLLVLQAWDGRFDLGPADKTANYSQYQSFQTWSQQYVGRDLPFLNRRRVNPVC
jgi:hypothetical protein